MTWSWWVVGALIEDEEADGAGWHDGDVPPDMEIVESHVHGAAERRGLMGTRGVSGSDERIPNTIDGVW